MSERVNHAIHLKKRPTEMPSQEHFDLVEEAAPVAKDGEILVRNIWMSVDPYMRGRMRDIESYVPPFQIGQPLEGGCIGQVVESNNGPFPVGTYVSGMAGWREYWTSNGKGVLPVDPKVAPVQAFLGVLGMPGLTAYAGLTRVGQPKEGETVFVSAASGAVGSVVCQVAKAKGCRVVGSAGSDEKVEWLEKEAGVDAAFNYKTCGSLTKKLAELCPKRIDIYFENVGGEHLEAALIHMNNFGRVAVCGMIDQYNSLHPAPGPRSFINIIPKRLRIEGFIVTDHFDLMPTFHQEVGTLIAEGKLKWKETVYEGLEKAPEAFIGLFSGQNFGKMLVKLGPDPAI